MKKNLYFEPGLRKKDSPISLSTSLMRKYFPKYLRNFYLPETKDASIKSKVKKIKIIRNFSNSYWYKSFDLRILFANKFKYIKTLENNDRFSVQFLEKIRLFKNIASLKFTLPIRALQGKYEEGLIKACERIPRLNKLRSLTILAISRHGLNLLEELNSFPRLLSSLRNLSLSCSLQENSETEMINFLESHPNLLRYVTDLKLGVLSSNSAFQKFQSLANACPNLRDLSFEFTNRSIVSNPYMPKEFSQQHFPVEVNYLNTLQTFQDLKSLRLDIADTFTFLNDFLPPPSIQNLTLDFEECLTKEIMLKIDENFTDENSSQIFKENPTLRRFYEEFQTLHNLETLEILLSPNSSPQEYQYQNFLIHQILQRIPSLKKFTSNLSVSRCSGLNKQGTSLVPLKNLYLHELLESCQNFSQTLHTLEIGDRRITFSNLDFSASRTKFPSLSTIMWSVSFDNPETDIYSSLEQIISLGDSIMIIRILTFVNNNVRSLLSILEQLSKLQRPEKLKIELLIRFVGNKSLEDIEFDSGELFKELEGKYSKLGGVYLNLFTKRINSTNLQKFFEVYAKKFENFKLI